jgi:hypothetical protein
MKDEGNAYRILFRKPQQKRPLGRSTSRYENKVAMDLREITSENLGSTHVAQGRDQW